MKTEGEASIKNIRVNLEKIGIDLFLFSLFFSNLFSRMTGVNLNGMFYGSFFFIFLYSLAKIRWNILTFFLFLIASFFTLYILDYRYDLSANLLSLKDVVIPFLCFIIGIRLYYYQEHTINYLNALYLLFVSYGIVQEMSFYTSIINSVLPWDVVWLKEASSQGMSNLYQGPLLRFFGVMNAFVEYQIYIVFVFAFLWLNKDIIRNKYLLIFNFISTVTFLLFSFERSPILMLLILLFIWNINYVKKNLRRIVFSVTVTLVAMGLLSYVGTSMLKENILVGTAFQRIENILTINFSKDEAVQEREKVQWAESLKLALENYYGIGPGRVTPSAFSRKDYIAPHNNFMFYYLAYGIFGLLLFVLLLLLLAFKLSKSESNFKYFGYGTIVSYCAMALFNLPFIGKTGVWFFVILGYLTCCSRKKLQNKYA